MTTSSLKPILYFCIWCNVHIDITMYAYLLVLKKLVTKWEIIVSSSFVLIIFSKKVSIIIRVQKKGARYLRSPGGRPKAPGPFLLYLFSYLYFFNWFTLITKPERLCTTIRTIYFVCNLKYIGLFSIHLWHTYIFYTHLLQLSTIFHFSNCCRRGSNSALQFSHWST